MTANEAGILTKKFIDGANLAVKRLIERTQKEDGYLVISKDGKVVRVKARDLK